MADRIVSPAILPILLRVLKAIRITTRERRFLIAAPNRRRLAESAERTAASLCVGGHSGYNESERNHQKGNEPDHGVYLQQAEPQLQTTSHDASPDLSNTTC